MIEMTYFFKQVGGTMKNKIVLFTIVIMLWGVNAQAQDVPLNLQAKLMLKILSMDRNFARFGDPIKIGTSDDNLLSELNAIKGKMKVKGKDFVAEKMASPDDVTNFKVIYVGKNWASNYAAASGKAAASQVLMFCETEQGVMAGGGAVSFKAVGGKPKIVVNLENAKKQGTDFPANFLKVTVVVGGL